MGWLDDLKKGMDSGHAKGVQSESEKTRSLYNKKEEEIAKRRRLAREEENLRNSSDSVLLSKYNSIFSSDNEKRIAKETLLSRGYRYSNGRFNK